MQNPIEKSGQTAPVVPGQYLTFTLGGELFAVGTLSVREIIEYGQLTPVPMMPPSILGVINLRGSVVPVIDLRLRFGESATQISRRTCIIILEVAQGQLTQVVGIVVDAVNAVLEITAQDVEPAPRFGARVRSDFILGMGKVDGKLVILLDIGRVLSAEDIALLASAERPNSPDLPQP
ncbi:chemotaxis protein CheW [Stutzerimonas azotifigens]|uniref:Purine-binding chemotaxis protein CheW n=1 Tax=Stutzerimonas azotifigens TaxID=291995 RepID=A0ABR5Z541_9GAMM|nr:chemotaxis protein CheW [Stutzerimonas azotifigens]MBA1275333.1 purine-binding chemotaxis protein CheW [Stutzerimonas azotifigens]